MKDKTILKKDRVLQYFIWIVGIVCGVLFLFYFWTFHGKPSGDSSVWGDFGSYFASITGLIAFLGVLYTIQESKKQVSESEERGIFFKMLELYQKQADSITNGEYEGVEATNSLINEINDKMIIYVIYKEIIENDSLNIYQGYESDKRLKFYFSLVFQHKVGNIESEKEFEIRKGVMKNNLSMNCIKVPHNYNFYKSQFHVEFLYIISNVEFDEIIDYVYENMRHISDTIYDRYRYSLGQYFRNIYYLMEEISSFKEKKRYAKLFRAQLSSSELVLLLYNAVSSQSSKKTVQYLIDYDILSNINPDDIILFSVLKEHYSLKEFISKIFSLYMSDHRNTK